MDLEAYFLEHNPAIRGTVERWREKNRMEQEIKNFVLNTLEAALENARDDELRALKQQERMPQDPRQ